MQSCNNNDQLCGLYIPIYSFKDFRLVDQSEVAKFYIIRARVCLSFFLLGTYNICTV